MMFQRVLSSGAGVIQICWIAPGPVMLASVNVACAPTRTEGEIFQPWPRSRAAFLPVPSVAMPARPFSPMKLSGPMERDCALETRYKFPKSTFNPSNASAAGSAEPMPDKKQTTNARNIVFIIFVLLKRSGLPPSLRENQSSRHHICLWLAKLMDEIARTFRRRAPRQLERAAAIWRWPSPGWEPFASGRVFKMPFDFKFALSLAPGFSPMWSGHGSRSRFNGLFGLLEAAEAAEAACRPRITGLKPGANESKNQAHVFENTPQPI